MPRRGRSRSRRRSGREGQGIRWKSPTWLPSDSPEAHTYKRYVDPVYMSILFQFLKYSNSSYTYLVFKCQVSGSFVVQVSESSNLKRGSLCFSPCFSLRVFSLPVYSPRLLHPPFIGARPILPPPCPLPPGVEPGARAEGVLLLGGGPPRRTLHCPRHDRHR